MATLGKYLIGRRVGIDSPPPSACRFEVREISTFKDSTPPSLRLGAGLAEQVDEEAEGAGVAFGQLARERQACVDIETLAGARPDEAAFQVFFSGIVHGEHGVVLRVPLFPEVEATLLNPAVEIVRVNFVGEI